MAQSSKTSTLVTRNCPQGEVTRNLKKNEIQNNPHTTAGRHRR